MMNENDVKLVWSLYNGGAYCFKIGDYYYTVTFDWNDNPIFKKICTEKLIEAYFDKWGISYKEPTNEDVANSMQYIPELVKYANNPENLSVLGEDIDEYRAYKLSKGKQI